MTRESFAGALREHLIAYGAQSCAVFSVDPGAEFPRFLLLVRKDRREKYDQHFSAMLKRRDAVLYDRCFRIEVLSGEQTYCESVGMYAVTHGVSTLVDLAGGATGCCEVVPMLGSDGTPVTVEDREGTQIIVPDGNPGVVVLDGGEKEVENPKISKNEGRRSENSKRVRARDGGAEAPVWIGLQWTGDNLSEMRVFMCTSVIQDNAAGFGSDIIRLVVPHTAGAVQSGIFLPGAWAIWQDGVLNVVSEEAFQAHYEFVEDNPSEQKISKDSADVHGVIESDLAEAAAADRKVIEDLAPLFVARVAEIGGILCRFCRYEWGYAVLVYRKAMMRERIGEYAMQRDRELFKKWVGWIRQAATEKEWEQLLVDFPGEGITYRVRDGGFVEEPHFDKKSEKEIVAPASMMTGTKEQLLAYERSQKRVDQTVGEVFQETRAAADVLGPWMMEQGATHYRICEIPDKKLAVIALIPHWDRPGKLKFDDAIRAENGVVAWMIKHTFMAHDKHGYEIGLTKHANHPYIEYVRSGEIAIEPGKMEKDPGMGLTAFADDLAPHAVIWGASRYYIRRNAQGRGFRIIIEYKHADKQPERSFSKFLADRDPVLHGYCIEPIYDRVDVLHFWTQVNYDWDAPGNIECDWVVLEVVGKDAIVVDGKWHKKNQETPPHQPLPTAKGGNPFLVGPMSSEEQRDREAAGIPRPDPEAPDGAMHEISKVGSLFVLRESAIRFLATARLIIGDKILGDFEEKIAREWAEMMEESWNKMWEGDDVKLHESLLGNGLVHCKLFDPITGRLAAEWSRPERDPNEREKIAELLRALINERDEAQASATRWESNYRILEAKNQESTEKKTVYHEMTFNGFEFEVSEIKRWLGAGVVWSENGLESVIILPDGKTKVCVGDHLVAYSDKTFEVKSA